MSTVLGVDLGKTTCRAAVWPLDGGIDAKPNGLASGPGAPGLAEAGGVAAATAAIGRAWRQLDVREAPALVGVGAAGSAATRSAQRELAERLRRCWPQAEVAVASDAITSHAGALRSRPGIVLAAGTGAVAIGVGEDGRLVTADGWGPWLGDDGSGAWIGQAGLGAVLAALDGRGALTTLTAAAVAAYGQDLSSLPSVVGGADQPVRELASFAPRVATAAEGGDAVAASILDRAADGLASGVLAVWRRLACAQPPLTALTGGLFGLGAVLTDRLTARLGSAVRLVPALGSSLDGARWLAEHDGAAHEPSVMRIRSNGVWR